MEGTDVCFAPVLSLAESRQHPHQIARGVFTETGGMMQVAPAPRFSVTPSQIQWAPSERIWTADQIIADWDE
jgi:alpha-methylacyl-CoA racemase